MSSNHKPRKETNIYFNISSSNPHILEGLEQWLKLGLFSQQEVKEIARNHLKCDTNYYINQQIINNPNFLEGLEVGLNLGLISEKEVKEIAKTHLVCSWDYSIRKFVNIPIQEERRKPIIATPPKPKKPSVVTTFLTSFKDELSVRWLLFLGVFLVVLSSGVLAASQWAKFPVFAQYGVLLSYTLVFWGVGFYAAKQENLKLTAQTLQTITLLLTPVNFWAIDTFGLWHSFLGGLIAVIAIFLLTGITIISNGEKAFLPLVINFLGLSLLHLGWKIDGLSLVAVYIGMIGTAINLRFILPRQFQSTLGHKPLTLIKTNFVSYGLAILLIRAIFVVHLPIFQLGLALAICGWLLTLEALGKNGLIFTTNNKQNEENNLNSPVNKSLEIIGAILIFIGWLLTVFIYPFQAILISSLALHWLSQRLTTYWLEKDLFWLFIIGLQTVILIRNIIPDTFKQNALNLSVEIAQSQQYPYTVFGVTLFPYLIFFVWLTGYLYQKDQAKLARFGEYLTLSLGICLTIISYYNPTWRSLNLILSTLTLIYINFRYQNKITSLIYFTHLTGVLTLISCLLWLFPQLNLRENIEYWGVIFIAFMILELTLSILPFQLPKFQEENAFQSAKIWFNSCGHFGLICLSLTYYLLIQETLQNYSQLSQTIYLDQQLSFLMPLTLTGVAFATNKNRRENAAWLSLIFLFLLQIVTFWHPLLRAINCIFTTVLIFINSRYVSQDQEIQKPLIYLNHIMGLIAIITTINYLIPNLNYLQWNCIYLTLMVIEWAISLLQFKIKTTETNLNNNKSQLLLIWYQSCYHLGFIFALISYVLFIYNFSFKINLSWLLSWSVTPLSLTFLASQNHTKERQNLTVYSAISLTLLAILNMWFFPTRIISLTLAIALMLINIYYYQNKELTQLHLAFAISLSLGIAWEYVTVSQWFIVGSSLSLICWLLREFLSKKQRNLSLLYSQSAQEWAIVINNLTLFSLTYRYTYFSNNNHHLDYLISEIILFIAFLFYSNHQAKNFIIYCLGWITELILIESISLVNPQNINLATGNIIFSLITLILSYSLAKKSPRFSTLTSWQILPLIYAIIGLSFRLETFNNYTGLLVIGASITAIGVSIRNKQWKFITYFALAGITLGCYETTIYQLLQKSGGSPADGLTILTLVTVAIALLYRLFILIWHLRGKKYFLNFNLQELIVIAHFHWGLASILQLITIALALETSPKLSYLSLMINFFLGAYAVIQAREENPAQLSSQSDWWVYVGLVEIVATCIYARLIFKNLQFLDPFQIIIVVLVALFIYQIPWQNLGWKETPWHRFALVTPALIALTNSNNISIFSLICVAIFYSRIALRQKNIRWSYISLGFIDWAIFIFFNQYVLKDPLWFISIISLSILYIAQFDPELIKPEYRKNRHNLRIFGSALLTVSALILHTQTWLIPVTISLIFIMIGLGLQIRAFLYVGTIVFMLTNFYHLVVLITESSLSKWIIGFVTGILLIIVAGIFERKRETIFYNIKNWFEQMEKWD